MVRNRKRKTENHGRANPSNLKEAVEAVLSGRQLRDTARKYSIAKTTLSNYVKPAKEKGDRTGRATKKRKLFFFI